MSKEFFWPRSQRGYASIPRERRVLGYPENLEIDPVYAAVACSRALEKEPEGPVNYFEPDTRLPALQRPPQLRKRRKKRVKASDRRGDGSPERP